MNIKIIKKLFKNKLNKYFYLNNKHYIFGAKIIKNGNLTYFRPIIYTINDEYKIINEKLIEFDYSFLTSYFIRQVTEHKNDIQLIVESRTMHINEQSVINFDIKIKKNLDEITIDSISKLNTFDNYYNIYNYNNNILSSKLEIDEERPDYYWGKYLFAFQNENKEFYRPTFDNIVDYTKDKGHLLHFIEESKHINKLKWDFDNDGNCVYNKYLIIFSIRHKYEKEPTKYYYKIYSAYSDDLKYFYNTKEIKVENPITESMWYCYPEIFKINNKYYILLNQDDFGQEKESLLGELIMNH